MKRYFSFFLLILLFGTSCNLVEETGSCEENAPDYEAPREPVPNKGGGWVYNNDGCGEENVIQN